MATGYKSSRHIESSSFSLSRLQLDCNPRKSLIGFSSDNPIDRRPIRWTQDRMIFMREFFKDKSYPYRYLDFSSTYEDWGMELKLFSIALDANFETNGIIPCSELIFYCSTGPEYSKALKNFRQDCFLRKIKATTFKPEPYDKYSEYNLKIRDIPCIDSVFPYRFCIFWEEDCDDTEWYKIPVKSKKSYVEQFRSTLRTILKDIEPIDFDPRLEILNELSKSKALIENKRDSLVFRKYRGKKVEDYFSTFFSPCERAVVPVYPQGYRDTVITSPEDSSTIRLIERVTCKILDHLPFHLYGKDPVYIHNELKSIVDSKSYTFLCRDIAKEGITKPRYLLKICLEELSKIAPILSPYINFYESFSLKGYETERGHGLGMANALTTLIQVTISAMINQILSNCGFETQNIHYYSFNDDFCCILPDDILDEYWDTEGKVFEGLSLIRKEEKSFFSQVGMVFCEIYILKDDRLFSEKPLSLTRTILLSFAFDFIYEAKAYVNSLSGEYDNKLSEYMEEILAFWGYEFFPDEYRYPFSFGGWRSEKFLGYCADVKFLDDLDYDSRVYAAYKATQAQPYITRRKDKQKFSSMWNRLIIPDETLQRCCPVGSDEQIKNKYRIYHQFKETSCRCRRSLQQARLKIYHKCRQEDLPYEDFINLVLQENPKMIPPDRYIEWIPADKLCPFFTDPYIQDTPLRNYLAFRGELFCYPISNYPEDYSILEYNSKVLRPDSWNVETFFKGKYVLNEMEYLPINSEQFSIDDGEFSDLPNRIIAAVKFYGNDNFYPKFLLQRNKDIGIKKQRVYGELLPVEEQVDIYLGLIRKDRMRFIIEQAQHIPRMFDNLEDANNYIASISEEIPSCDVESEASDGSDLDIEVKIQDIKAYITQYFSAREYLTEIPNDVDIYDFVFNQTDHSLYSPSIQEAVARVKELFILYYHRNRNVDTDSFMRNCVLVRPETTHTITLLQQLGQQGYCKELVKIFGIETPEDEDFLLDTEDLFSSCP